ncbi:ABC transporter permease [Nitrogeniibacter aestuarii]|uniref:ABC transporter permease n=1 Tax=Nitrogeniibacter aestuarii TaxID=2815343 RepID=UPI001D0FFF1E|nr:FtsX-like permease family protein [Nitrogeniibacter aestuarii]
MIDISLFQMAWRNLWRNQRRSLATIVSLAFGFGAIALFAGYTHAIYMGLSNVAIHTDLIGHLTVNKDGWRTMGKLHPARYLLTGEEIEQVRRVVAREIPGARVIERMTASGLVSNGRNSTIFIAEGISAPDMQTLRGPFRNAPGALVADQPHAVTMGEGLADTLGLAHGDPASILVSTIHGQANAADIDVGTTVNTGNLATNDKWMVMPLALVQDQMDAVGRAEYLTIVLPDALDGGAQPEGDDVLLTMFSRPAPDDATSNALRDRLLAVFNAAGLSMEVRTWQEMSTFYRQVRDMYNMIFGMMLAVVLSIVVLSIGNAMSMAVVERTREIGTLRAMGMRRHGISRLFVTESVLLVAVGLAAGLALMLAVRAGVNALDVRYIPPGNTTAIPLYVAFDGVRTLMAAGILSVLAIGAAFMPSRKASRQPITVSLGHV